MGTVISVPQLLWNTHMRGAFTTQGLTEAIPEVTRSRRRLHLAIGASWTGSWERTTE